MVQLELVFGERFPKGPFHVEPVIDLLLQIEVEMPVNAPAVALCMIKREIRSLEQFLDRAAVAWPHRAADAASAVELRSAERRLGQDCVRTCRTRWSPDH